jgi:glycosyltransferase involved in cell wall biosynthesis
MRRNPADGPITVLHFGNDAGSVRGGIAAVIRQHLFNPDERLSVSAIATYDPSGRGHRSRNAPYARALRHVVAGRRGRDVVAHIHLSQGGSLAREGFLVMLLRLRRIPVVVTLHGSSSLSNGRVPFMVTGMVLRAASVAHFLSDAHRRRYERLAGRRHVTMPNAVSVERAEAASKQPDIVFAGVVGTRKGVDLLLKAWQSLPNADWTLHLYGPPDSDFPLPQDIPGVVAHGEVAPAAVQNALASASIAVLPSREEAFPMFLVEAMAHGCAIVATDVGGVRELLGDAGALVPADDAGALGEALTRLISEPGRRAELSAAAGRRAAERFDARPVARQWAETYVSLTGRTSTSSSGAPRG